MNNRQEMKINLITIVLTVIILASFSGPALAEDLFFPYAKTDWTVKSSGTLSADATITDNNKLLYCPVGTSILCYDIDSGNKLWEQKLNLSGKISHPLVILGNNIYAGGLDGIQQIKINGSLNWTFKLSPLNKESTAGALVSPASADLLYVGIGDCIYGLEPGGNFIWRYFNQKYVFDCFSDERAVYVCGKDKDNYDLVALNSQGERIWHMYLGNIKNIQMCIGPNQNLYVTTNPAKLDRNNNGKVRCIDAKTGDIMWDYTLNADNLSSTSFSSDQKIFFVGDKKLYCLNAITGSYHWDLSLINLASGVAIDNDSKRVYAGSSDGRLFSISFTGKTIWQKQFDEKDAISRKPVFLKDEGILIYTKKGMIMKIYDTYKE